MSRWAEYVTQRLDDLGAGRGDFTGLQCPSVGTVATARKIASAVFRDTTPTPSVVPSEEGAILFVWHKNGIDARMEILEGCYADLWVNDRRKDTDWSGRVSEHLGCCVQRFLDALEREPQPV